MLFDTLLAEASLLGNFASDAAQQWTTAYLKFVQVSLTCIDDINAIDRQHRTGSFSPLSNRRPGRHKRPLPVH
jgi:hypothetical protein